MKPTIAELVATLAGGADLPAKLAAACWLGDIAEARRLSGLCPIGLTGPEVAAVAVALREIEALEATATTAEARRRLEVAAVALLTAIAAEHPNPAALAAA